MSGPKHPASSPASEPRPWLERLRGSFSQTPRTLRLVWQASRGTTLTLAVLTVISAALPVGIAWVGKRIVDAVTTHDRVATWHWVAIELAIIVVQAATQRALGLARQLLGARLGIDINVMILEKAARLELRQFEDADFYDKMTRARREASSRPLSVVNETFQLLQNVLTLLGYVAVLLQYSAIITLGLVIAAIPAAVAEVRFSNRAFRLRNWRSPDSRRLNYLEYVLANDDHAKEVKLLALGDVLLQRYKTLAESFYVEDSALAKKRAFWAFFLSLLAAAAFYGAYASMAVAAAAGVLTIGMLTLYVVAFRQGQQAFQSILAAIGGMYEDNLYMTNLFEFLSLAPSHSVASGNVSVGAQPGDGIRFVDVGFRYPTREDWALRHIDLHIPHGQSLALVGHNGAGKTTFIKLLTGLYDTTEGEILLDGTPLPAWEETALRARMSVVFQDYNQYQLSLGENVGLGSAAHLQDQPRLGRAVDSGGAREVVDQLPEGFSAQLGGWFRQGVELSGGQWQKIALSRAFMREEADILILDEPTAALDAESEHAVFARFRALTTGRTSILISHRFPTVRMAEKIVVLEHGTVQERGSHAELLAKNGRYAQLFKLQAEGYS